MHTEGIQIETKYYRLRENQTVPNGLPKPTTEQVQAEVRAYLFGDC